MSDGLLKANPSGRVVFFSECLENCPPNTSVTYKWTIYQQSRDKVSWIEVENPENFTKGICGYHLKIHALVSFLCFTMVHLVPRHFQSFELILTHTNFIKAKVCMTVT